MGGFVSESAIIDCCLDCGGVFEVDVVEVAKAFLPLFFIHGDECKAAICQGNVGRQRGEVSNELLAGFLDFWFRLEFCDGVASWLMWKITVDGLDSDDVNNHCGRRLLVEQCATNHFWGIKCSLHIAVGAI